MSGSEAAVITVLSEARTEQGTQFTHWFTVVKSGHSKTHLKGRVRKWISNLMSLKIMKTLLIMHRLSLVYFSCAFKLICYNQVLVWVVHKSSDVEKFLKARSVPGGDKYWSDNICYFVIASISYAAERKKNSKAWPNSCFITCNYLLPLLKYAVCAFGF